MNFDKVTGQIIVSNIQDHAEEKLANIVYEFIQKGVQFQVVEQGNNYIIQFNGAY